MTTKKKSADKTAQELPPDLAAKVGRPSRYTREIADYILGQIAHGRSLASICKDDPVLPSPACFRGWVVDDVDGISARSARAYEIGHDAIAEECLEIADASPMAHPITGAIDAGDVQHKRVRIDSRLRLLGKWAPKKYGDKIDLNHSGKMTLEQLVAGQAAKAGDV